MGGTILFFILTLFLVNSTLLETYYTNSQKDKLTDFYELINEIENNDYESFKDQFVIMETTHNIDIVITDNKNRIIYTTNRREIDFRSEPKPRPGQGAPLPNRPPVDDRRKITRREDISDDVQVLWTNDINFDHQILMLTGRLDSGDIVELIIPFASIKNSIKLFNNFMLVIGVITLIITLISSYILSGHFTKPILEINRVTKRMKKLQFDQKCQVISNDEIGQLADGINDLSMELFKRIEELRDVAEKRKTLLNNVSHELKTPLALMQGYAEGLKKGLAKNSNRVDFYCEVIEDEAKNMTLLVEELLNLDELDQGSIILNKSSFEINSQLKSIFKKFTHIMDEKSINYTFKETKPTMVYADNFRIERVFTNYLTNAINYVDKQLEIYVSLESISDRIRVSLFNTSSEITDHDLERVWDSFYKIDKARTRDVGGHGLGLSIIKAIQELHGSEYGVNRVKDGVIFWFDINKEIPST